MQLSKLKFLAPGDTVQIVAPASKPPANDDNLKNVQALLESWGLRCIVSNIMLGENPCFPELANTDALRFLDLKNAIIDSQVQAIWCLKGGYGTVRLLNSLTHEFKQTPQEKFFIGFSDITLLHLFFQQQWGWRTLHGPGALQVVNRTIKDEHIQLFKHIIFGELSQISLKTLTPMNEAAKQTIKLSTSVVGGNFTLVNRTLGTPYAIDIHDKVLILEDVSEPFRKIDGMLQQLKLANYFTHRLKKPAAVILGKFSVEDELQRRQIDNCLDLFAAELNQQAIPVLRCLEIGHGDCNFPFMIGTQSQLELGPQPVLRMSFDSLT